MQFAELIVYRLYNLKKKTTKTKYKFWQHDTEICGKISILFLSTTSFVSTGSGRFGREIEKGTGKWATNETVHSWKVASNRNKTLQNKWKLRVFKSNEILASSQFRQLSTIICNTADHHLFTHYVKLDDGNIHTVCKQSSSEINVQRAFSPLNEASCLQNISRTCLCFLNLEILVSSKRGKGKKIFKLIRSRGRIRKIDRVRKRTKILNRLN